MINGRINYIKGIQINRNDLLESILWIIQTEQETKWIKIYEMCQHNVVFWLAVFTQYTPLLNLETPLINRN